MPKMRLRTTTAVVQGSFLVIVLDSVFAVFFTGSGWADGPRRTLTSGPPKSLRTANRL